MSQVIKVGFIGCGRIFNKHLSAIESNKELKLVAVCDEDKNSFKKLTIKNINKYSSCADMMTNEDLDLVSILTPSGYHLKNFLEIYKNVKNILIEKPLTTNLNDAKKLIKLSEAHKKNVFVVLQNRFNKPIIALKKLLDENNLGKIFLTSVRVRWCRDEKYYNLANWRGTKKLDGGVLFNQAAHHVDMITWLNGRVKKVKSLKNNLVLNNIEHEDTLVSSIEFENGSIGSLEITVGTRPQDLEGSISVLGTKGSVEISGFSMDQIKHWNFYKKIKIPKFKSHDHIYGTGHVKLYEEVVKSIYKKKNIAPTMYDGYDNIKLIEQIYKSSK